jgi:flagellar basal-body rod modification protein FlgD
MSVSSINSVSSTATTDQSGETRVPTQTLDQNDFLQLLVTQMTQQDPMNPMKDTEFIAQMASFSALEQSKEMQQDMALLQATDLIGRTVSLEDDSGTQTSGTVSGVEVESGAPKIIVDGVSYDLSTLRGVMPAVTNT